MIGGGRVVAIPCAFGIALSAGSCLLDFDGLSGGLRDAGTASGGAGAQSDVSTETAGGGGGESGAPDATPDGDADADAQTCVSGPGCSLCHSACDGGKCERVELAMSPSASQSPFTVAVTDKGVFWADHAGAAIVRIDASGAKQTLVKLGAAPKAVSSNAMTLAWATDSEGLSRCTIDDCENTRAVLVPASVTQPVYQLALDATDVFWIPGPDFTGARVQSCKLTGCGGTPVVYADAQPKPRAIALDGQHVYWTVPGAAGQANGSILRASKNAVADAGSIEVVRAGLESPTALALSDGYVYFTNGEFFGGVYRCKLGATGCAAPEKIGPDLNPVDPVKNPRSVAVDAEHVFWTNDEDATVMACPPSGCNGNPLVVSKASNSRPGGIQAIGRCLYFTERPSGQSRLVAIAKP